MEAWEDPTSLQMATDSYDQARQNVNDDTKSMSRADANTADHPSRQLGFCPLCKAVWIGTFSSVPETHLRNCANADPLIEGARQHAGDSIVAQVATEHSGALEQVK